MGARVFLFMHSFYKFNVIALPGSYRRKNKYLLWVLLVVIKLMVYRNGLKRLLKVLFGEH